MAGRAVREYRGVCLLFLNTSPWPELTQEGDMFAELQGPSGHQGGGTAHCWVSTGGQRAYNKPALTQQVPFPAGQVQPLFCPA